LGATRIGLDQEIRALLGILVVALDSRHRLTRLPHPLAARVSGSTSSKTTARRRDPQESCSRQDRVAWSRGTATNRHDETADPCVCPRLGRDAKRWIQ